MKSDMISIQTVAECVAAVFNVPARDLRSARKPRELADARQALYLLASELTQFSAATIGRHIGDRNHTTVLYGVKEAARRCEDDAAYAEKVDAARIAASVIASSSLERMLRDPDALATARRVCSDPMRHAMGVSTLEVAAMAVRLLELEEAAATTFDLLAKIDEVARLQLAFSSADRARWRQIVPEVKQLTEVLSGALASLGYSQEKNDGEGTEDIDGAGIAGSAVSQ